MAGNVSSQYISALLMIAPTLKNGLQLRITDGAISRPYIDLTLWMMREYGADADWSDADTITVNAKPYERHEYTIESDWSAAAYWYERLALRGNDEPEPVSYTTLRPPETHEHLVCGLLLEKKRNTPGRAQACKCHGE